MERAPRRSVPCGTIRSRRGRAAPVRGRRPTLQRGSTHENIAPHRLRASPPSRCSAFPPASPIPTPASSTSRAPRSAASAAPALGYLLGGLIGGKTARIVGAGIGGVAGGVIGYQHGPADQASSTRRPRAPGVDVTETPDGAGILVNLPDVTFAVDSTTI